MHNLRRLEVMPIFTIQNEQHRKSLRNKIADAIKSFESLGKKYKISILDLSKSRLQEEKYHAMICDIVKTCKIQINGMIIDFNQFGKSAANEYGKSVLVRWYQLDCEEGGEPLRHNGFSYIDPIDGQKCAVRPSTKDFTVKEAANFIEFLYSIGAQYGVAWSERVESYNQYPELNNG